MRFDYLVAHGIGGNGRRRILSAVLLLTSGATITTALLAQQPTETSKPPEMLMTEQGFLAIDSPKGWVRTAGPGLARFVPPPQDQGQPLVWIYISSAAVVPNEEGKDLKAYIGSNTAGCKRRFKNGEVQREAPLRLPRVKLDVPVRTFRSNEKRNTAEQVVYVAEATRVLTLVLSAREPSAFAKALPTFRDLARSYRGSITPTRDGPPFDRPAW
jgi:hypothetical protein